MIPRAMRDPHLRSKRRLVLAIVATDRTFARSEHRGEEVWLGKCLHCNAHLAISLTGEPISNATIEHILPRTRGGGDDLPNLGLACARCNREKGSRHDRRRSGDTRSVEVIARLLERRRQRWRDPPA